MRLGIDSRDIFAGSPRGVGKAIHSLVAHLVPMASDWQFTLFTNRNGVSDLPASVEITHIDIPGDRFNAWENIRLPLAAFARGVDILHCPSQSAPFWSPCPFLLTVHDLIPLRIGDGWSSSQVEQFRRNLMRAVARARRIVAVSHFTKRDLMELCGVPEERIDVVHWGVEPIALSNDERDREELYGSLGLTVPFFTAFGGGSPRKNVRRILEALARFVGEVSSDVCLVLLGVPEAVRSTYKNAAADLGLANHVLVLGYLPEKHARQLVAGSEAMVYPSLYEGFGLPILEAMAVGAPVITSDRTSMPEVAGDAAILVDPTDAAAITEAMRQCYGDTEIKRTLRQRGFDRITGFTWQNAAKETLASYQRAVN